MKKINPIFLGECVIIVALLLVIGFLIKDRTTPVYGKESTTRSVSQEVQDDGPKPEPSVSGNEAIPVEELLKAQGSVSGNGAGEAGSVSGNGAGEAGSVSGNGADEAESVSGNTTDGTVSGNAAEEDGTLDIVVFGDSIWDDHRGENGVSELLAAGLNANVYNCAIGGSAAAVKGETTDAREGWTSTSFNGMMYIANGEISADALISDRAACEVIKQVDFSKVEYIIVSYGLNDYFSGVRVQPEESVYMYDMTTYVGALRHGINKLKERHPHIEIIVTSPTYGELWDQDSEITKYGGDTLNLYAEGAAQVAAECDAHFVDMYHGLGITKETLTTYTKDDVHLSEEGRLLYAGVMTQFIQSIQESE